MKLVDMHIHSTCSDGIYSPEDVVDRAVASGLGGMALTDHDTTDGIARAMEHIAAKKANGGGFPEGFMFIAGCEFSTFMEELGEVHILGYFSREKYPGLSAMMNSFRQSRVERAKKILSCLRTQKIHLNEEALLSDHSRPIGRMHIARALVKEGYFHDVHMAFDRMLKTGSPCYIPRREVKTLEMIREIKNAGGVSVVAHPVFLHNIRYWDSLEAMLAEGLSGVEYRHPKISNDLSRKLEEFAGNRLILTAGSDFHGDERKEELGRFGLEQKRVLERFSPYVIKF